LLVLKAAVSRGQDHEDLRCPRSRRESPWSGGASSPAWRQAW